MEEESNAQAIEDDSGEKLEAEEGGGAVSLTYSNEVTIDLSDKAASLVFANPGKSVQDMVVQIVIDDTVIVQSGHLKAGQSGHYPEPAGRGGKTAPTRRVRRKVCRFLL